MLLNTLLVAGGGLLGAITRYIINNWVTQRSTGVLPWATLFINITGSFVLGFLWGAPRPHALSLLLGTGFLGAYTTFSTFKLETVKLLNEQKGRVAVIYLGVSYSIGILAAFVGYTLAK